jgi:hypothetical protein
VARTQTIHTFGNSTVNNLTLLQHCFHVTIEISIYIWGFKILQLFYVMIIHVGRNMLLQIWNTVVCDSIIHCLFYWLQNTTGCLKSRHTKYDEVITSLYRKTVLINNTECSNSLLVRSESLFMYCVHFSKQCVAIKIMTNNTQNELAN